MRVLSRKPLDPEGARILFFSSVGQRGKPYLEKLVNKFQSERPDMHFLIACYDGSSFENLPDTSSFRLIHEQGFKFGLAKKHLSCEMIKQFDLIFVWDDDLDVETFSLCRFLEIFCKYDFELAQPALTPDSEYSHEITLQCPGQIGRKTDFVEIMAPVFRAKTWKRFARMITPDNKMGWGLDLLAQSYCKVKRMGIIDETTVKHCRPIQSWNDPQVWSDMENLFRRHRFYRKAKIRNFEVLK